MKKELIELFGAGGDPIVNEVLKWLPDAAYDVLKDIADNAEAEGADWATRQMQSILQKHLPCDVFTGLMELAESGQEEEEIIGQVREMGRELWQNADDAYERFLKALNSAVGTAASGNIEVSTDANGGIVVDVTLKCPADRITDTGSAIEAIVNGLNDDEKKYIIFRLLKIE